MNKLNEDLIKEILKFNYTQSFCVLGDCSKETCHHCFPVKNCKDHEICKKEGILDSMEDTMYKLICCNNKKN